MKKDTLHNVKNIIKYIIYVASITTACYGFWGCLFPDLTLVGGTYRVIESDYESNDTRYTAIATGDMETLYANILEDRVTVVYCSKVWEIIKSRFGFGDD